MTMAGVILGTAAYMSPEQAKGRGADKRSDLWAFGCVLFEMLTAKRPFEGEDVSDTLAAVLRGDPIWNALPAEVPAVVRTTLQQCLEKDRRRRIADASTIRVLLSETTMASVAGDVPVPRVARRPLWARAAPFAVVALAAIALSSVVVGDAPAACAPGGRTLHVLASGRPEIHASLPDGSRHLARRHADRLRRKHPHLPSIDVRVGGPSDRRHRSGRGR